jgi:transposase
MNRTDARSFSSSAQQVLREKAMVMLQEGMTQQAIAKMLGVHRGTVTKWHGLFQKQGARGLEAKPRGRPRQLRLNRAQENALIKLIRDRCPDQLKLPFALWTREAVSLLIEKRWGLKLSVWTVGRYLKRWEFSPQKPLRRAFEQNPEAIQRWLDSEYPAIALEAKKCRAEIHWGDEMGLRSDHQTGTSWAPRGQTPVIPGTGQRFRCNVISTVTNRGHLSFMVYKKSFRVPVYLQFLARLIRNRKRRIFLIVDRHPVHLARATKRWLQKHSQQIRVFYLPPYAPELNPDELLNQDVKSNALGRLRPRDREEMMFTVRQYLRCTQKIPAIVRHYFCHEKVRYAA